MNLASPCTLVFRSLSEKQKHFHVCETSLPGYIKGANGVSEQVLNGTLAQLGYTVPCHSHRYTLENTGQKTNQTPTLQKLNTTQKQQTTHYINRTHTT